MEFFKRRTVRFRIFLVLFSALLFSASSFAQIGKLHIDLNKDKPEKFQKRKLRSEKTGEKKFNLPRRFIQNTASHYNFYFNAQNKLDAVIERARLSRKNDFSKLLPFYSYSLNDTKAAKNELDSVISKSTAGILLHDLRSDWVDDFYFLIGRAYFLQKEFDSAFMTFQFINYNLKNTGKKADNQAVGSAGYESKKGISIVTPEEKKGVKKVFSKPPARNDALIQQIRTLTELGEYGEAAGLINTLQNDPNLPSRLVAPLEEVLAYWFYKQEVYDSTIVHLENSLENALDKQDLAYREFLLAQLHEMQGNEQAAKEYYNLAIRHTTDPVMDIYANLNQAISSGNSDPAQLSEGIQRLLSMARKDKFEKYRDIIYFSAAQMAMQIPDTTSAITFYGRSAELNQDNLEYKNRAFLSLASLYYDRGEYRNAYNSYDSLQLPDSSIVDIESILHRKGALAQVVTHLNVIEREDSLQQLSAMSSQERDAYLKALSKRLRKERGVKETGDYLSGKEDAANEVSLFGDNAKGDWYFYNNSIRSRGASEFRRIWGKRTNTDNWRRESASTFNTMNTGSPMAPGQQADPLGQIPGSVADSTAILADFQQTDFSVSALAANIPLTSEALDSSNARIAHHLFQLGKNYQNLLEDYDHAAQAYEESLGRFPDSLYGGEIYANLFYCYYKMGNLAMADKYKQLLLNRFPKAPFADYVLNPRKYSPAAKDTAMTALYENIYLRFIEGDFKAAIRLKQEADSLYGSNSWTPQLLYIEAVYHVKTREDSAAISILNRLMARFPGTELSEKAAVLTRVLNNRDSIENYLANLDVERVKPGEQVVVMDDTPRPEKPPVPPTVVPLDSVPAVVPPQVVLADSLKTGVPPTVVRADSIKADGPPAVPPAQKAPGIVKRKGFIFDESEPQNVVMLLVKVDPVYGSEARTAFNRYNRSVAGNLTIVKDTLDKDRTLLVFEKFENMDAALDYLAKVKKDAGTQVSWLPKEKYSFFIISPENLELLKETKDLEDYINLLKSTYPNHF